MRLKAVKLQNFRAYADEICIPIDMLTALVGTNDIGKSTVLEALDIFFEGGTIKIDRLDASVDGDPSNVRITCVFTELPEEIVLDATARTSLQGEYLLNEDGDLEITKVFDCTKSSCSCTVYVRALHPSVAPYASLLQAKNPELKRIVKDRGVAGECDQNDNSSMRRALYSSAESVGLEVREIRIDDKEAKAIWESLRRCLPIFGLFQADRPSKVEDAEVQDPMKLAIKRALSDVEGSLEDIKNQVRERAIEIAQATVAKLSEIDPGLASHLDPRFKAEPNWGSLFKIELDDDRGIPMNKRGSGVRRMILLSFFRAEVERRRAEEAANGNSRPMLFAIEEPETAQHPANQRVIVEALKDLSASGDQVVLTTHDPALAGLLPLESIRFIDRSEADDRPRVRVGDEGTLEVIADALGVLPSPVAKEMPGVKVALVLEGHTDDAALSAFSEKLHAEGKIGFSLVEPCPAVFKVIGGGSELQHWVERRYLDKLGIPQVHIYDSDRTSATCAGKRETAERAEKVRKQPNCTCFVTRKREVENYLHPAAIERFTNGRVTLSFGERDPDYCDMEELVYEQFVQTWAATREFGDPEALGRDGNRLKLNKRSTKTIIAECLMRVMTAQEIVEMGRYTNESGAVGSEVLDWFAAIEAHVVGPVSSLPISETAQSVR